MKSFVVIGDSHIRAFSYNPHFIPLFIGPAAFNNFLNDNNKLKVQQKIDDLLSLADNRDSQLLFLFSGDVEHICRKYSQLSDEVENLITSSAERYCELVNTIATKHQEQILVSLTLPGGTDFYNEVKQLYSDVVIRNLSEVNLASVIDFNERLVDKKGFLKAEYKADFAHLSYRGIKYILQEMVEKEFLTAEEVHYSNDFRWWSSITINTDSGPFKIWGDTSKDELIIEPYEKLVLKFLQNRSTTINSNLAEIVKIYQRDIESNGATVFNAKQGQITFPLLRKTDSQKIRSIELSDANRVMFNKVSSLVGTERSQQIYGDVDRIENESSVFIDFNWWKTSREIQNQVLKSLGNAENLKAVAIFSHDQKADCAIFSKKVGLHKLVTTRETVDGLKFLILEKGNAMDRPSDLIRKVSERLGL